MRKGAAQVVCRDEDGLIEQLRGRVKHVEEESLLVQGERGTDEGPLSLGPGGDGHRPASGAGPHSECAVGSTQHQALGIQPHGSGHLKDRVAIPTEGGGMEQGSRVTTGISAFPWGWPWEAQSSPRVVRESWGWRSSHCRAEETSLKRVSGT